VQSRPVGSSDRLDAGAHGWNIEDLIGSPLDEVSLFWFGTLLGPEGTAAWLSSSAPDRSAIAYRVRHGLSGAFRGWVVSRWVFEN